MGMVDYSGSAVVHFTGGITALYAACILGARRGRFYDREGRPLAKPGLTKGHSIALQMLGTMILWFCWYGFNSGSALLLPTLAKGSVAARAAVNTTIGAAAGTLSALLLNGIIVERQTGEFVLDIVMSMNGWYVTFCPSPSRVRVFAHSHMVSCLNLQFVGTGRHYGRMRRCGLLGRSDYWHHLGRGVYWCRRSPHLRQD
jgi:hypothetical protein